MTHTPRKRFGQNFLVDDFICKTILSLFNLQPMDSVIEIGPGRGALTATLLKFINNLVAIEIDKDLYGYLQQLFRASNNLQLVCDDALQVSFDQWGNNLRIVGNLPYNISTQLLFHLLKFLDFIQDMQFMVQKEVARRLTAIPGNKEYGKLSILMQYHCKTSSLLDISPQAFFPKPKVFSTIIRLVPYKVSPYQPVDINNFSFLLSQAFKARRKTLHNNLKSLISEQQLRLLEINPKARPEQISIVEYIRLVNYIHVR